jgi:hypothetical protein
MLSEGDTEGRLTCGRNMEFVNGSLGIEESTLVEKIVAGIAVVGDLSLDLGVSERSELDIEGSGSSLEVDGSAIGSGCQCKELSKSDLHDWIYENSRLRKVLR